MVKRARESNDAVNLLATQLMTNFGKDWPSNELSIQYTRFGEPDVYRYVLHPDDGLEEKNPHVFPEETKHRTFGFQEFRIHGHCFVIAVIASLEYDIFAAHFLKIRWSVSAPTEIESIEFITTSKLRDSDRIWKEVLEYEEPDLLYEKDDSSVRRCNIWKTNAFCMEKKMISGPPTRFPDIVLSELEDYISQQIVGKLEKLARCDFCRDYAQSFLLAESPIPKCRNCVMLQSCLHSNP